VRTKQEGFGLVYNCQQCAKNQNTDRPCPTWLKYDQPPEMLNCPYWRRAENHA